LRRIERGGVEDRGFVGPNSASSREGISMAIASPATPLRPQALYTHAKAQHWGLAILAWEREHNRGYQFEDGVFRVINEDYYRLIEEVDAPADQTARIISDLRRKLGDAAPPLSGAHAAPAVPELSFDDQVRLFTIGYPQGFADPAWIARHRGTAGGRRAKGHMEPAFAEAQAALAADVLDQALAANRASSIVDTAAKVLEHTSLLTDQQLRRWREMSFVQQAQLGRALRDLLHGTEPYELRFERFVAGMTQRRGPAPTWQLATALPALFWPDQHICVRETTFREQAKWTAPRLIVTKTPGGVLYLRLADMARSVQTALDRAGHAPRDLMDVHLFMVMTLMPSARNQLADREDASAAQARASGRPASP
jgi:hypothetical protein